MADDRSRQDEDPDAETVFEVVPMPDWWFGGDQPDFTEEELDAMDCARYKIAAAEKEAES